MADRATPNLPSRDFGATIAFFAPLGFSVMWRDAGWLILANGALTLEFFPCPDLDPAASSFGACLRLDDMAAMVLAVRAAGVPERRTGLPRLHAPRAEPSGLTIGYLIDPDGSLLRLIQN